MTSIENRAIVVGLDGTAHSGAALDWAIAEATRRRLPLRLFSAAVSQIVTAGSVYTEPQLTDKIAEESLQVASDRLEDALIRVRALAADLKVLLASTLARRWWKPWRCCPGGC